MGLETNPSARTDHTAMLQLPEAGTELPVIHYVLVANLENGRLELPFSIQDSGGGFGRGPEYLLEIGDVWHDNGCTGIWVWNGTRCFERVKGHKCFKRKEQDGWVEYSVDDEKRMEKVAFWFFDDEWYREPVRK